jgi:hypothetical protein
MNLTNKLIVCLILLASQIGFSQDEIPHLQKKGNTTQLIVDQKPYLILGGELGNSSFTSLEYMEPDSNLGERILSGWFRSCNHIQKHPNPFSQSTRIDFEIPETSFVSLLVYNLIGQEVAVITEEEFSAGRHSATFDASHLANGIYFYTLKTGDFIYTKKNVYYEIEIFKKDVIKLFF